MIKNEQMLYILKHLMQITERYEDLTDLKDVEDQAMNKRWTSFVEDMDKLNKDTKSKATDFLIAYINEMEFIHSERKRELHKRLNKGEQK
jgi:hypothetical protein